MAMFIKIITEIFSKQIIKKQLNKVKSNEISARTAVNLWPTPSATLLA